MDFQDRFLCHTKSFIIRLSIHGLLSLIDTFYIETSYLRLGEEKFRQLIFPFFFWVLKISLFVSCQLLCPNLVTRPATPVLYNIPHQWHNMDSSIQPKPKVPEYVKGTPTFLPSLGFREINTWTSTRPQPIFLPNYLYHSP